MIYDYEDDFEPCPKCGAEFTRRSTCQDCDDGWVDDYDEDPLWFSPGDSHICRECHGTGNIWWCPKCGYDLHLIVSPAQEQQP